MEMVVMTQYNIKQGLKEFGADGTKAVVEELKQLHEMGAIKPLSNMTRADKHQALQYLMYLKRKRCGRIKGRGCADGRKQRVYTNREDASSPTVSVEALFLTSVIDASEERYVVTCDVPGAFLQTDMDELVHIRFDGTMAEALASIDPSVYNPHLSIEKGKSVLYAVLKKALYGTLRASLLFWKDLSGFLIKTGFQLNPYDNCVANMTIRNEQCTVVWHVDDLKISHRDPRVVETLVDMLNQRYGQRTQLAVTRGPVHDYLGMTLDYSTPGKIHVIMTDYVMALLDETIGNMDGTAVTPASPHLFQVNPASILLNDKKKEFFHHIVAKLLFLCKRARPDLQTTVAFLTTRVKAPDHDDWNKLRRCMRYLRATKDMHLTLEGGTPMTVEWYVDGSFATHHNMRSHTGGYMTVGKGAAYAVSIKQKLNTRSSTEAELVAVNDVIAQVIWTRYFLQAQGMEVGPSKIYQDNLSAMLMEKNGRGSSSKRTRHIDIRYFFIADRVNSKQVTIEHCPTELMIGDFFTKPLQGAAFHKFRKQILNPG
jgi:Reverse transcriptase (RNA-dependent DNA polymerase)